MPRARMLAVAILGFAPLALPGVAHAYIDPASGSLILQALLGGVAGVLVVVKLYYRKLARLFGRGGAETDAGRADGDSPSR